jgi:hypothetical protein
MVVAIKESSSGPATREPSRPAIAAVSAVDRITQRPHAPRVALPLVERFPGNPEPAANARHILVVCRLLGCVTLVLGFHKARRGEESSETIRRAFLAEHGVFSHD